MSAFFVRRPIVAIVIAILMTLVGGVCILALPIAQYPQIAPPEVQVRTHYTGADALTIEQSVAAPIEQQMSGVDNMNYMYSINANTGDMRMIVNFDVATDANVDQILAQLRVSQAQSQLPPDRSGVNRSRADKNLPTRSARRDDCKHRRNSARLSFEQIQTAHLCA